MRNVIRNCCLVLLGLIGFKTANAQNVEMFLCINGEYGNTNDSKNDTGCIDVLAWSWGGSNSTSTRPPAAGQANFQDLNLTKYMDNSSTYLMTQMTNAAIKGLPIFQLRVRQGCGIPDCVGPLLYQLEVPAGGIVVSSSTGGGNGETRLTEVVSFNMPSSTWCYADLDDNYDPTGTESCGNNVLPPPP